MRRWSGAAALALGLLLPWQAQAQLFGDDEARQAILDLRQRFDESVRAQNKLVDDNESVRRSLLGLQQEIDSLRSEMAQARGKQEELQREIDELKKHNEQHAAADNVALDESQARAVATTDEKQAYDEALQFFRDGDFKASTTGFSDFVDRYPSGSLTSSALFWLGNAQYATRDYNAAIASFESLLGSAPNHEKSPEALLSIANCQVELGNDRAAKDTLRQLIDRYPDSEAAQAAHERLG